MHTLKDTQRRPHTHLWERVNTSRHPKVQTLPTYIFYMHTQPHAPQQTTVNVKGLVWLSGRQRAVH